MRYPVAHVHFQKGIVESLIKELQMIARPRFMQNYPAHISMGQVILHGAPLPPFYIQHQYARPPFIWNPPGCIPFENIRMSGVSTNSGPKQRVGTGRFWGLFPLTFWSASFPTGSKQLPAGSQLPPDGPQLPPAPPDAHDWSGAAPIRGQSCPACALAGAGFARLCLEWCPGWATFARLCPG